MPILDDGEFALTEGVPQLDGAVMRSGDNLSVVGRREGNGQDFLGVVQVNGLIKGKGNKMSTKVMRSILLRKFTFSLEAVKSMLGSSDVVAISQTQLPCPEIPQV